MNRRDKEDICDLKAFLPSRDYEQSIRFYSDLGFHVNFSNADVTEFQVGNFRFLLTPFYAREYAENLMMQLMVSKVHDWWDMLQQKEMASRYPGIMCKAPEMQPWGLEILYLSDPAGVLWHIAQAPAS